MGSRCVGESTPLNEAAPLPRRTRRVEDFEDRAGIRRIVLSGGRCAAGAVKREFLDDVGKNGPRIVPTRNLRSGCDSAERRGQRRSVQRLANMASGVRTPIVLVQKASAAGEVEQCQTEQRRADRSQTVQLRVFVSRHHTIQLTPVSGTLDAQNGLLVALLSTIYRYELLTRL